MESTDFFADYRTETVVLASFSISDYSEAFADQNSAWLTHHTHLENMHACTHSKPVINTNMLCFVTQ